MQTKSTRDHRSDEPIAPSERARQLIDPYLDHTRALEEGKNPHLDLEPGYSFTGEITPLEIWQNKTREAIPKDLRGTVANHHHASAAVEKGQPHRKAQFAAAFNDEALAIPTFGSVMLPESYDLLANNDPEPPAIPQPAWTPATPAHEILRGAAHDLATTVSVMSARLRHSIGFEADTQTIDKISELAFSLSKLHYILNQTQPKRARGRPKKNPKK